MLEVCGGCVFFFYGEGDQRGVHGGRGSTEDRRVMNRNRKVKTVSFVM